MSVIVRSNNAPTITHAEATGHEVSAEGHLLVMAAGGVIVASHHSGCWSSAVTDASEVSDGYRVVAVGDLKRLATVAADVIRRTPLVDAVADFLDAVDARNR